MRDSQLGSQPSALAAIASRRKVFLQDMSALVPRQQSPLPPDKIRFPSSRWRFVTKKEYNELRGARIHGDLPWRGVYESARPLLTASPHRLSARSLLRENFNSESFILSCKKCTHEICSRKGCAFVALGRLVAAISLRDIVGNFAFCLL